MQGVCKQIKGAEMKDEIILNNINLIYSAIKKLNLYNQLDEFFSIGMIGLVRGANNYDESLGYKQSTYLYKCIYNAILMEFRNNSSTRRIPKYKLTSLSTEVGNNLTLADTIEDETDIEEDLIKKELIQELYQEISKLTAQEQLVINLSFGVNGCEKIKQNEIGIILNLSQAQVSRIKNNALSKLRKAMQK